MPGGIRTPFDYAIHATMKRAAAVGDSPNRITLLRDADGDGVAEVRETFLDGLNQPFGMALVDGSFYVGNTDGVVAFPYADGATRHRPRPGRPVAPLQARRPLDPQPAGEPRRPAALRRRRLAQQHRRRAAWRPRRAARRSGRSTSPPAPPASSPPACATRSASPGIRDRHALDRRQRARRPRRRDPARLPDLGRATAASTAGPGATGARRWTTACRQPGDGRQGDPPRLRARRPHRLARPLLASGGHAAGLPRRHGDRSARLMEPQQAQRLQGDLRALRERPPSRSAARHPQRLPLARRARVSYGRPVGVAARPATARCWSPTTSAT